jgi:hypothetical protein
MLDMNSIPLSLKPFLQEYDISKLNPDKDSFTIIERVLQFGNRQEIKWMFYTFSREKVFLWLKQYGNERLPQPHLNFWKIVLELK